MRVFEINMTTNGSTGKIMFGIADAVKKAGGIALCAAPIVPMNRNHKTDRDFIRIGSYNSRSVSNATAVFTGRQGCTAYFATKKLIKTIDAFAPDVVQLHNLHGNYIDIPLLFKYIKRKHIRTVWTLHDCWAFTGRCAYFTFEDCQKWKNGCGGCRSIHNYPKMLFDNTRHMWNKKRKTYSDAEDLTVVTPSQWLARLAGESFLQERQIRVINNGIDLELFRRTESDFRQKYGLEGKKIVLGVSFAWEERKGADVFNFLAANLPDDYKVVMVGTDPKTEMLADKRILTLRKTEKQAELAEIYSAADVFANPTREENFPTVNIEALACGTPVVTFRAGGSPEIIDEACGIAVDVDDKGALLNAIKYVAQEKPFSAEACIERAKCFSQEERYAEYIRLYEELVSD